MSSPPTRREIWSRSDPWENIEADKYAEFFDVLQRSVLSGVRPTVPPAASTSALRKYPQASGTERDYCL